MAFMSIKDKLTIKPVRFPHPGKLLIIESLDYPNPYDFHQLHRHDYFEIILVKDGAGTQLIDFSNYTMGSGQVFTIYPGQVHLMERTSAKGLLIQFRKDIFEFTHPLKHYHLYFPSPVFMPDQQLFHHLYDYAERIQQILQANTSTSLSTHKAYNYLQIILISLTELYGEKINFQKHHLITEFLSLLTHHIHSTKKVVEYCAMMRCSPEKLNQACRKALGKTALELIHEELLLEIRRLLLLDKLSLKEIAYELNFDTQQNFSGFIKNKTGLTPSELQQAIREIYTQ